MNTRIKSYIFWFCALISLCFITACQSDDDATDNELKGNGGYVMLRIGVADDIAVTRSQSTTRAPWNDDNAENDRSEMMYNWTVLLCDNDGVIKYVYTGTPPDGHTTNDNAEIDEVTGVLGVGSQIAAGTYTAYSFANISSAKLADVLDISGISSINDFVGKTISDIDAKSVSIDANLKTTTDITADNAFGLGSKGIPMSNKQNITVTGTEDKNNPQIIDLIVVRMVAKLEFIFFNRTAEDGGAAEDFTVKSVSISDITKGTANNLKLLPNLNKNGTGHENEMTFTHGDIKPNLNTDFEREEVKYAPTTALTVASTDTYDVSKLPGNANASDYTKKFVFYVNESQLATPATDRFHLTVELSNGDYRYALVSTGDNSGLTVNKDPENPGNNEDPTTTPVTETKRSDDWTYIARNDYRVIPIVLDNYRLELVPYDFPAIGVYPASVKTVDATTNLHEILFHDYGHFHLVPHVYRGKAWIGTEGTGTETYPWEGKDIAFSATLGDFTSTVWTLDKAGATAAATDWPTAFTSFATTGTYPNLTKGDELTIALNSGTTQFYGAPGASGLPADNVWPTALPAYMTNFDGEVTHTTADGKTTYSQGDFPVLDAVTQWKPRTSDSYLPFIFGQIAPQADNADKTVYHEFRVNVYVEGESVARQLVYRFYMHLKQDFGLARRYAARPTCRLHCHE